MPVIEYHGVPAEDTGVDFVDEHTFAKEELSVGDSYQVHFIDGDNNGFACRLAEDTKRNLEIRTFAFNFKEWWESALSGDVLSPEEKAELRVNKKGLWQGRALMLKHTAVDVYRAIVQEVYRSSVSLLLVDTGCREVVKLSEIGDVLLPLPRFIAEMQPSLALRCVVRTVTEQDVPIENWKEVSTSLDKRMMITVADKFLDDEGYTTYGVDVSFVEVSKKEDKESRTDYESCMEDSVPPSEVGIPNVGDISDGWESVSDEPEGDGLVGEPGDEDRENSETILEAKDESAVSKSKVKTDDDHSTNAETEQCEGEGEVVVDDICDTVSNLLHIKEPAESTGSAGASGLASATVDNPSVKGKGVMPGDRWACPETDVDSLFLEKDHFVSVPCGVAPFLDDVQSEGGSKSSRDTRPRDRPARRNRSHSRSSRTRTRSRDSVGSLNTTQNSTSARLVVHAQTAVTFEAPANEQNPLRTRPVGTGSRPVIFTPNAPPPVVTNKNLLLNVHSTHSTTFEDVKFFADAKYCGVDRAAMSASGNADGIVVRNPDPEFLACMAPASPIEEEDEDEYVEPEPEREVCLVLAPIDTTVPLEMYEKWTGKGFAERVQEYHALLKSRDLEKNPNPELFKPT